MYIKKNYNSLRQADNFIQKTDTLPIMYFQ